MDAGEEAILRAKVVPPLDDCVDLVKDKPNTARLEGEQELLGLWLEARRREKLLGGGKEHLDVLGGLVPSLHSHLGEVNGADDVVSKKVHLVLDDGDQGANDEDHVIEGASVDNVKEKGEDLEAGALAKASRELDKDVVLFLHKKLHRLQLLPLRLIDVKEAKGHLHL